MTQGEAAEKDIVKLAGAKTAVNAGAVDIFK
jgi:hypothetical protein